VDEALAAVSPEFEKLYAKARPTIDSAGEDCFARSCCRAFYSVRSELQLMEQLDYNLLFRWFVGLSLDEAVWDENGVHQEPRAPDRGVTLPGGSWLRCSPRSPSKHCCRMTISRSTAPDRSLGEA